jgi:hypothetical protein
MGGSELGCKIIKGCPTVDGDSFEVVGVDIGGALYLRPCIFRRISSSLVRRIL